MKGKKKHPLLRHPILFTAILAIVPLQLCAVLGILTAKLANSLLNLGLNAVTGTELGSFLGSIYRILVSLLIVFLMKRTWQGRFRYGFDRSNVKLGFLLASPTLIMAAFNIPEYLLKGGSLKTGLPLAAAFVTGFAPGLYEEVVLRGTALSNMMYQWKDKSNPVLASLTVSSLIFGALHLINLSHAGVTETLMQVGYAAGVGFLFGAVYLRTRNLVGLVILHAMVDISAAVFQLPENAPEVIPFTIATTVILTVGGTLLGLWMVRKEKQPEILALFLQDSEVLSPEG